MYQFTFASGSWTQFPRISVLFSRFLSFLLLILNERLFKELAVKRMKDQTEWLVLALDSWTKFTPLLISSLPSLLCVLSYAPFQQLHLSTVASEDWTYLPIVLFSYPLFLSFLLFHQHPFIHSLNTSHLSTSPLGSCAKYPIVFILFLFHFLMHFSLFFFIPAI